MAEGERQPLSDEQIDMVVGNVDRAVGAILPEVEDKLAWFSQLKEDLARPSFIPQLDEERRATLSGLTRRLGLAMNRIGILTAYKLGVLVGSGRLAPVEEPELERMVKVETTNGLSEPSSTTAVEILARAEQERYSGVDTLPRGPFPIGEGK